MQSPNLETIASHYAMILKEIGVDLEAEGDERNTATGRKSFAGDDRRLQDEHRAAHQDVQSRMPNGGLS